MPKYTRRMPTVNAESVTNILIAFKDDYNKLPKWVKEAYESMVINTVTEDSFNLETETGIVIANQDDYLVEKENGQLLVMREDTFKSIYKEVVEDE